MPSRIEGEALEGSATGGRTLEVIERWLTAELERHAIRVDKIGWRDTEKRRRVSAEQLQRLYRWAMRDLAPIVEEVRRLGFTLAPSDIDDALFGVGRGRVAAADAARSVIRSVQRPERSA